MINPSCRHGEWLVLTQTSGHELRLNAGSVQGVKGTDEGTTVYVMLTGGGMHGELLTFDVRESPAEVEKRIGIVSEAIAKAHEEQNAERYGAMDYTGIDAALRPQTTRKKRSWFGMGNDED